MDLSVLPFVTKVGDGWWVLDVWVQPGAKKTEMAGCYQKCLKIRLQAPAVDNKANKALVDFVAKQVGLKKSQVELASGHGSRKKRLNVFSAEEPDWSRLDSQESSD